MRKLALTLAAAAAAVGFSAPASAQWAPPVYQYHPYNYGYGFNGINFANAMASRVQRIRNDIRVMHARRILSNREARGLDNQARSLQRRIFRATRNGISPGEARSLEVRIFNLQRRVAREANDWDHRYGRYHRY